MYAEVVFMPNPLPLTVLVIVIAIFFNYGARKPSFEISTIFFINLWVFKS